MLLYISRDPFLTRFVNSTRNKLNQELQIPRTYSDLFHETGVGRGISDWRDILREQSPQSLKCHSRVVASLPDLLDVTDTYIQLPASQMLRNLLPSQDLCTALT